MITDADFQALKDEVAGIKTILGDWTKQYSAEEMFGKPATAGSPAVPSKLLIPANELANGEYPLAIQQRRLNFIADAHDGRIEKLEAKPSVVIPPPSPQIEVPPPWVPPPPPPAPVDTQAIIAAVLAALSGTSPDNTINGTMVVNGDILVRGRVAVFYGEGAEAQGFQAVGPHQVQMYGDGAGIAMLGNTDKKGRGGVSPNTIHGARVAVDGEGGVRMTLNPPASSVGFNDPNHGGSTIGFDSDGELSLLQDKVNAPAPGQHLRVHVAHDLKEVQICLGLPGWRLVVLTSNSLNQFEKRYLIPDVG